MLTNTEPKSTLTNQKFHSHCLEIMSKYGNHQITWPMNCIILVIRMQMKRDDYILWIVFTDGSENVVTDCFFFELIYWNLSERPLIFFLFTKIRQFTEFIGLEIDCKTAKVICFSSKILIWLKLRSITCLERIYRQKNQIIKKNRKHEAFQFKHSNWPLCVNVWIFLPIAMTNWNFKRMVVE